MKDLNGKIVLVTGGGSGMGRLVCLEMAKSGANVVCVDLHAASARDTASECADAAAGLGTTHHAYACDVSDREGVYATCDAIFEEVGPVDVLVNNAGIVSGKTVLEVSDAMIEKTFQVNVLALFWFIRKCLPGMLERDEGHIVNMGSASGLAGVCGLVDYSASKHAVAGLDESLRLELARRGSRVRTTVIHPYYVATPMFEGVRTRFPWLLPILKPDYVAGRIMAAVKDDTAQVIMPRILYTVPLLRALPVRAFDWIADFLGISASMDTFKGRGWTFYNKRQRDDDGAAEEDEGQAAAGGGKRKKK